jgi:hypothetical protein
MLQANLAGHFGGSFWRVILVGQFGGSNWRVILASHFGESFWRLNLAGPFRECVSTFWHWWHAAIYF